LVAQKTTVKTLDRGDGRKHHTICVISRHYNVNDKGTISEVRNAPLYRSAGIKVTNDNTTFPMENLPMTDQKTRKTKRNTGRLWLAGYQARKVAWLVGLLGGATLSSCLNLDKPPAPPAFLCNAEESGTGGYNLQGDSSPSFDDEVLAILSSTKDGQIYKCTVCHNKYEDYETVKSSYEAILKSVKPNPTNNNIAMPIGGGQSADFMKAADLATLEKWRASGFPKSKTNSVVTPEKPITNPSTVRPNPQPLPTTSNGEKEKTNSSDKCFSSAVAEGRLRIS
jgi:hypothetical protein